MTSKEIEATAHAAMSANQWLKEVAMQLALMNELLSRKPGQPWQPAKGK